MEDHTKRRQSPDGTWQELHDDGYWYAAEAPSTPPGAHQAIQVQQTSQSTVPAGAWLAVIGGLIIGTSSLLPWVTASVLSETITRNAFQLGDNFGFSWDGVACMVLGVVTVIIGIVRLTNSASPPFLQRSAIATGIIAGLVFADRYSELQNFVKKLNGSSDVVASVSYGYWLLAVGAVVATVSGFILRSGPASSSGAERTVGPAIDAGEPVSGYYIDPQDNTLMRFWDGKKWTSHTQPSSTYGA